MAYATLVDLAGVMPPKLQAVPQPQQLQALEDASEEADGYIRCQYTLPLAQPYDRTLVRKVCQLACWFLVNGKGRNVEAGSNDTFEKMRDDAISWLNKLATKRVSLASGSDASPGISLGGPRITSQPPRGWSGGGIR